MSVRYVLGCIVLSGLLNIPVCAQSEADSLADKMHTIGEVMVKARRLPVSVSSAQPVQFIGREQLEGLGLQSVADAVRRFAGATVRDYGGIGGLKTVSVRSLGAGHTAVSYDGVAVSNTQAGQIDIGRFSLDNVEELSLAVGQGNDLLQSARAYASAGILSIRTQQPVFSDGEKDAWQVRLRGGSFGYVTPSLRYARKLGGRTSVMVEGDYMRADGIYPFILKNGRTETTEHRRNSDIYSWHVEGNLYHTFKDESRLMGKGYFYKSERGLPGAVKLYNLENQYRERLWDENFFAQLTYDKRFTPQLSLRTSAKYGHTWSRYEDRDVSYVSGRMVDINRQDEYYLSASLMYQPWRKVSLSLAQDGAVNTLRSNLPRCPFPVRYTSLTALNLQYTEWWMTLQGALLNTFVTEEVKSDERPDDRRRISPSLGVTFRPWQERRLFVRFLYKHTFRVPTFNDMYYQRIGNKMLRSEKAVEYNVGITYDAPSLSFMDYLTLTVDGYINRVDDKIVAIPAAYVWKMSNYGRVHISGVDAVAHAGFPLWGESALHLSGTYTFQRAIDRTDPQKKNYGDQIPYTPRHTGSVGARLQLPWVNVGYTALMVSRRYSQAQNIAMNEIPGYAEHTLTLARNFQFCDAVCRLQGELVNFTNEQYEVIHYYPMPGRTWRVTLQVEF
jgi:outer membrane cobalamin receptor